MKNPFKKKQPTPLEPVPGADRDAALLAHLATLRMTHVLVRDPDGTWTAYQKHPERGSWFVWRVLTMLPEVRGEKPIQHGRSAHDGPHPRQMSPNWDVPDTFPDDWMRP